MEIRELRKRLAEVLRVRKEGDIERAHLLEDGVRIAVLQAIATGQLHGRRARLYADLALGAERSDA